MMRSVAKRSSNVETAFRFLIGKGLTPAQAAGVIGSMQGESGQDLSTTATNPAPSHAFGIAQWLGGRKDALLKLKNPESLSTQLNFLWSELQGPERGALKALRAARTPGDAAIAWQRAYERGAPFEQKYNLRASNARRVFDQYAGRVQPLTDLGDGTTSSTPGTPDIPGSGDPSAVLAALLQLRKPQAPPSSAPPAPSFAAGPALPQGYQAAPSGGGPAPPQPDLTSLLPAISQLAGEVPGTPGSSGSSISADVPGKNTGPGAAGLNGGKSPLFELIYNGPQAYAVKNGQKVNGPQFYSDVWGNHKTHVHVAAGPNTVVALGKLAQRMGLNVGSNVYFTGQQDTSGHASQSYHYRRGTTKSGKVADEAIDVSGGTPQQLARYARAVESIYGLG